MMHLRTACRPRRSLHASRLFAADFSHAPSITFVPPIHNKPTSRSISTNWVPRILTPTFWKSLVPKPLRSNSESEIEAPTKLNSRDWNPSSFYIIMFLLIGSQAIHTISLHSNFDKFSKETDAKISTLRRVVERVRNGENVDVKKELGTGDPKSEKEWKDVLRELEEEDALIQSRRKRQEEKKAAR